jgi:hypothetical protein
MTPILVTIQQRYGGNEQRTYNLKRTVPQLVNFH